MNTNADHRGSGAAAQADTPERAALRWARSARFLTTASRLDQLPPPGLPEIAFVGRSNAGKSTAINTLAQIKRLAFASKTPGRTQHINLFELGPPEAPDALWADLPGYGYAAVARDAKVRWQQVMADYLAFRHALAGIVLMVDSRHGFTPLDRQLLAFIAPRVSRGEVKLLVLLTKADKLTRSESAQALAAAQAVLAEVASEHADIGITLFSALKRQGVEDAALALHEWLLAGPARGSDTAGADAAPAEAPPVGAATLQPPPPTRARAMTAASAIHLVDEALPHGITLSCRRAGADTAKRRILLLHGFPEAAFVWDEVMAALAPEALCVAPNLRGYERSSRPAEVEAYRPKHLVADVVALIERLGAPLDLLVAHDWGGGVAWNLAALRPDLVKRLVILNAPHPGTFVRALQHDVAQQRASDYMLDLVRPDAAERLARDDFAALWAKFARDGMPPAWLTEAVKDQFRAVWRQGLDGALNYYRASPLRPPAGPGDAALAQLVLPDSVLRVQVPTTVLWGEQDHALRPVLLEGLDRWVPDLTVHRLPEASHWIVHEQPAWVIARLREALASVA